MHLVRATALLLVALALASCDIPVARKDLKRLHNDRTGFDAVVYTLDAGATTSTSYHVAVARAGAECRVFTADKIDVESSVDAAWDNDTLVVTYPRSARTFLTSDKATVGFQDVVVRYKVN